MPVPSCPPDTACAVAAILAVAAAQPQAPALWLASDDPPVSYGALAQAVAARAALLNARGLLPGEPVALILPNGLGFVVSLLALWQVGAVAVPLNPRLGEAELAAILVGAGIRWQIRPEEPEKSRESGASLLPVPCESARRLTMPEDLAVLVVTSGTTGRPKGVMLTHANLLADARANIAVLALSCADRVLCLPPMAHVFGLVNVLLSALLAGASVVITPAFSPRQALAAMDRHGVTVVIAVPTMYQAMVSLVARQQKPPQGFAGLRVCHSGAAAMPLTLIAQIERVFGAPVQEGYGLSEATSIVCSNPLAGPRKAGSVGPAIPGVRLRVMTESGHPAMPGEIGELQVQGPTVMRGYSQRPAETAAVFTADGWLRTGDLACQDAEGYVTIAGRRDDLIIVGGQKAYPREIEDVLLAHPGIQEAAVAGVAAHPAQSAMTHQRIHAWLRPVPGADPAQLTPGALAAFCAGQLAAYKIPTRWHLSPEALPQGPSGKIQRHVLRARLASVGG